MAIFSKKPYIFKNQKIVNFLQKCNPSSKKISDVDIVVGLVGNANVGKSAIFNQLTGVDQIIGNWPGKTVEIAEGILKYKELKIKVVDLPGIYSFSTFSLEELVSREFIAKEVPDVIVNVIDTTALERNLFLTLQLIELNVPIVIALNQVDLAKKKGISIDNKKLEELFGVPVIPTIAIKGFGIQELTEKMIEVAKNKISLREIKYGKEVEKRVEKLSSIIKIEDYQKRWIAIKLLEDDEEVKKLVSKEILIATEILKQEIEEIHGEKCSIVITAERYSKADEIARKVQSVSNKKESFSEKIDKIALHSFFGYFLVIGVILCLLIWTFVIGSEISSFLTKLLSSIEQFEPRVQGSFAEIIWNGAFTGFVAGITLVIPYVIPFYIILAVIEDSGYLTRISFMLDKAMHKIGLHGKAIIPLILGYGCNVPACFSCRIMETKKQKLILAFLVTFIPCIARTVVILGLVALFVNIYWAIALYVFDIFLIIILGRIAFKFVPGESYGLIMEMPQYHFPDAKVVLKQTWVRTKSLILIVFPIYIIGSVVLQALYSYGAIKPISSSLEFITVYWLGLPSVVGVLLLFGIVRKELVILMLAVIFQTTNFASIMSSTQLIVLSLVTLLYIPCLATIFALAKEFGWKSSLLITLIEIAFAIFIGGIAFRILTFV